MSLGDSDPLPSTPFVTKVRQALAIAFVIGVIYGVLALVFGLTNATFFMIVALAFVGICALVLGGIIIVYSVAAWLWEG